ncbi:putative Fe-S protein [Anaerohalosphaera lusitana]|uniref:Putative Fe-S protein n=1 Tax=Anaerohalosphaera lusitana TaxID=1936003 RepID=A0A1U9NML4_9BACT|nr:alpha-N-acetylglucosaminidase TIM-barrel domain-containing protein [Anaerohalosphaera lusitana]AQT68746.1 putative Fe-S protein [Anaerohalosphaera lusitana]
MSKFPVIFAIIISLFLFAAPVSAGPLDAARGVISRNTPDHVDQFTLELIPEVDGRDVFEIVSDADNGKVVLKGSSPVSICSAYNWYLRYVANCNISWCGTQLDLPAALPKPGETIRRESPYKHGYYLNYCTLNYTMSFWDWQRWEEEIDYMALQGIDLPLAPVGVEAVWLNTLKQYNFTDAEAKEFICGPAFFGWWLMGNLEGWGGPLPQDWIDDHIVLQNKILNRMRELGMEPVMPAFYGTVPNKLKEKYPDADIRDQGHWAGGFKRPAFLSPTDPLFTQMANTFYDEQKKLFGECKYFSGDPFHEGGSTAGIDLPSAGENVINAMRTVSPDAVWVLQGWGGNPHDALIENVPKEDVLILDLDCDNSPQWYYRNGWNGYPWSWCMIHNFGGNTGMFGRMEVVATETVKALNATNGGNLVALGSMPEGIETNPVIYELLWDMRWRSQKPDMIDWTNKYAHRRYGKNLPETASAWQTLRTSILGKDMSNQQGTTESILCARPAKQMQRVSSWGTTNMYFDPTEVVDAWKDMLQAADQLGDVDTYQYDLTTTTRQVLANLAQPVHQRMISAFEAGDKEAFQLWSGKFLELLDDQDRVCATRKEFMLGPWIEDARAWGHTTEQKDLYEFNARTLITTWSYRDSNLHEYAHREWAGLISDFYKPRWQMFINELASQLDGNQAETINYYAEFEKPWTEETKSFPTTPAENSVTVASQIFDKYKNLLHSVYNYEAPSATLVAHWPLDETSGTTAVENISSLEGIYTNSPSLAQPGATESTGTSTCFAGSQYAAVPNDEKLNPQSFSVSLWVKPAGGSGHRAAVCSRHTELNGSPAAYGYILYATPGNTWSFWTGATSSDGNMSWSQLNGPALAYDEWTHITLVFEQTAPPAGSTVTGNKRIYINGQLATAGVGSMTLNSVGTFNIGSVSDPDYYFNGCIDDVQFYNGVLTNEQVKYLYDNPGQTTAFCPELPEMDFNGDCVVNGHDLLLFANSYLDCNIVPDCILP